jgi:hypothetical protein
LVPTWRHGRAVSSQARTRFRPSRVRCTVALARSTTAFFVAVLAILWTGTARATPFDPEGDDWEGLSQFVRSAESELGTARVISTRTLDLRRLDPIDALIVVHPTRALDVEELSSFMHAGGRIVLLDDYGTGDALLAQFGIRRRPLPRRPAEMLRGNPALAIAEPAGEHPAVRDVSRVVTNHATGLAHPDLSPVLVVRGDGEPDVLLAVAGTVGRGRMLAVGDASIPINSMLRYPGNRALALGLIRYATEDDSWGKRGGKLYILANDFDMTGTFGGADSQLANAATEARRSIARAFDTLRRDGMPPAAAYLAAVAVGIGIIVWTGAHAGKTHKLATPRFARAVPVAAQGGIAGHAAVLADPGTSRTHTIQELKSALEEDLATRLGLERAPTPEQLVARVRAERLLDSDKALALGRLFANLARIEARMAKRPGPFARARDAEILALAAEVRDVRRLIGLPPVPDRAAP